MTEIKRFDMRGNTWPSDDGSIVSYKDHAAIVAALQEQLSQFSMSAGHADQRKSESVAVRVALGFSADADDVAPCDLVDAIASLQEQVRALAAENKRAIDAVTVFSNVTHEITEIICDEIGQDKVAEILAAYNDIGNTPASDAALREIRAQAVEGFAEHIAFYHSDSKSHALYYAARIREGEQP